MTTPLVAILIPNYQTLQLTQLVRRLTRPPAHPDLGHVLVIDNDSNDPSLAYLRTLQGTDLLQKYPTDCADKEEIARQAMHRQFGEQAYDKGRHPVQKSLAAFNACVVLKNNSFLD
jgi:hypothetical protein